MFQMACTVQSRSIDSSYASLRGNNIYESYGQSNCI